MKQICRYYPDLFFGPFHRLWGLRVTIPRNPNIQCFLLLIYCTNIQYVHLKLGVFGVWIFQIKIITQSGVKHESLDLGSLPTVLGWGVALFLDVNVEITSWDALVAIRIQCIFSFSMLTVYSHFFWFAFGKVIFAFSVSLYVNIWECY